MQGLVQMRKGAGEKNLARLSAGRSKEWPGSCREKKGGAAAAAGEITAVCR